MSQIWQYATILYCYLYFVIPIRTSTNALTLVKIGPVVCEIIGEIGRF